MRAASHLHVRAVRRSDRPAAWRAVADAMGGREVPGRLGEQTFALAAGFLVVRPLPPEEPAKPDAPTTSIELGEPGDSGGPPGGPSGRDLIGPDGMSIARVAVPRAGRDACGETLGAVSVCPLWMTADVSGAATALVQAGLAVRLASNAGQWVDLVAPGGGLIAVHADVPALPAPAPRAVLAFEAPDISLIAVRFAERGLRADIVDESYGRSLRIDDPDAGTELWVNETVTDLYGYRRAAAP